MKWSVSLQAEGDRGLELAEIVELADAVAPLDGIASGMGTMTYGARLSIEAGSAEEAVDLAVLAFESAAAQADLPVWPITHTEVIGEDDELLDDA
ncbi:MAG: hypothetical protein V3R84_04885 [Acidimicrobiia bacterium]